MIESEYHFSASLGHMQAWCALHGHPRADIKGAVDMLKTMYGDVLSCIPYMTQGKRGVDLMQSDRQAAIEVYRKMRAAMKKKDATGAPEPAAEKPQAAHKKRRS